MVEWNVSAPDAPVQLRTPEAIGSVAQLARIVASSPRPFVLVSERELSVLRRGLTKDGWKRSLYLQPAPQGDGRGIGAGVLSIANQWVDREIAIPKRSGHYHHFFCDDCGSRLEVPEPLETRQDYACPTCGRKYSGEKYDGAIRYMQHNRLARAALALAVVYGIEKDRAYADKAAQILLEYASAYPGAHTGATEGGMMYQSLCEAVWIIPLAQAYDLIFYSRSLSEDQKRMVEDKLFRPVAEGLERVGIDGNWGSWHLSAVGVIGLAIKDPEMVNYALESLKSQLGNQLGEDGLWPESVHTYHFYPLSAFVLFAEGCYRAGIDLYGWEVGPGRSLKAMFAAPLQYMYPSFRLPAINDGWYQAFLPLDLYEVAHRRWDDSAFAWVLKKGYKIGESPLDKAQSASPGSFTRSSSYAFLFGRDLPGRSAAPVFRNHNFSRLGICTLRNGDDIMVTLDHGPFLGHGHLDKMSFTLFANGAVLAPDYGTPGYGSKLLDWYRGTAAHNTVVVDGKNQQPAKDYSLTACFTGTFAQYAEATATDCYPGVTHTRRILLLGSTCVISDSLASDVPHDYDWVMRCEGKPEVAAAGDSADIDASAYPHVDFATVCRADGSYKTSWKRENGRLSFGMWTREPGAVALGECPSETAARKVSFLLSRQTGREASFLAALAPSSGDGSLDLSRDGSAIRVAGSGWADYIRVGRTTEGTKSELLETDAEIAAIRTLGEELTAIVMARGSFVRWRGEVVLECPAVAECVEVSFQERGPVIRYCSDTAGVVKLKTKARAMRVNGHRAAATSSNGHALLRVTPQMLDVQDLQPH